MPRPEDLDSPVIEAEPATGDVGKRVRPLVEVRGLTKDYGDNLAVSDVSFTVGEGEIFGFIGPNGAGKTTTIRILSTLLEASAGDVHIDGLCVQNDTAEVRRIIGYMPDQFGVYDGLTVEEYLEFFARAYRLGAHESRRIIADVMELTDLDRLSHRLVSTFSKGMKQRLCLAKTLIHDPKLLILDEPASALDPRARIELRVLLKELREMGKTILISSHILTELSDLCTSYGIIEKGRLVRQGSMNDLRGARSGIDRVDVEFSRETPEALELVRLAPHVSRASSDEKRLSFDYGGEAEEFYRVLKVFTDNRLPILSVRHHSRSLEDVFLELTRGEVK